MNQCFYSVLSCYEVAMHNNVVAKFLSLFFYPLTFLSVECVDWK